MTNPIQLQTAITDLESWIAGLGRRPTKPLLLAAKYRSGLAWVDLPAGRGGLGLDLRWQSVADEEAERLGVPTGPDDSGAGVAMVGPAIGMFGTDAQSEEFLLPTYTGEVKWGQLFSEPNAGSDLAGLSTRAESRGGIWHLNGQKVWTSNALRATHGIVLARTGSSEERHRAISAFLIRLDSQGVAVRPIRQMNGESRFTEIFLENVEVGPHALLGEVGSGWSLAMEMLNRERRSVHRGLVEDVLTRKEMLDLMFSGLGRDQRHYALQLLVDSLVLDLLEHRLSDLDLLRIAHFGPLLKLAQSQCAQKISAASLAALGADGLIVDYQQVSVGGEPNVASTFLRSVANTIEGGTSEVLRNVVAERGLGLPR